MTDHLRRRCVWCVVAPVGIAAVLGCLFWIADAIYGYLAFSARVRFLLFEQPLSLWDSLVSRIPPHDLYIRVAFFALCFAAAALVATFLVRRQQAEETLERVSRIVENSNAIAFEWDGDADAALTFVTDNVATLLGYSAGDLMSGKVPIREVLHPADFDEIRDEINAAAANPETMVYALSPHRLIDRHGEVHWVDIRGAIHRDTHGRVTQRDEIVVDITDQRVLEQRLQEQQKLESLGILSAGVAHEINNPLTGVINYAELIRSSVDDERLGEFATGIIAEGNRIARIVSSLLTYARREADEPGFTTVSHMIDDVLNLVGATLRKDDIQLEVDVSDDIPQVVASQQQIEQVLINLLMNSRDALNQRFEQFDEKKKLSIHGSVRKQDAHTFVRITVEDNGSGIPHEIQKRIFDPFYTTKSRAEGTGLGLAISRSIAQAHDGDLSCESAPGRPTRFHLDLPIP